MVSCTDHEVIRQLDDVEAYLSEHPDSALSVLDSLSTTGIRGREANAKFALLYSMALDKSYIDATDDSLINIAVDWKARDCRRAAEVILLSGPGLPELRGQRSRDGEFRKSGSGIRE